MAKAEEMFGKIFSLMLIYFLAGILWPTFMGFLESQVDPIWNVAKTLMVLMLALLPLITFAPDLKNIFVEEKKK